MGLRIRAACLVLVVSGCGEHGSGASASDTAAEPPDDQVYPRPDDDGACPPDTAPAPGLSLCAPACDPTSDFCARPDTGGIDPICGFHPDSSGIACLGDSACPARDRGERCLDDLAGGKSCLRPASHCLLPCDVTADACPDAMVCYPAGPDVGLCSYP